MDPRDTPTPPTQQVNITSIALHSWNIDFMLPFGETRMKVALDHLDELVDNLASTPSVAPVMFLQECTPDDLATISSCLWVREKFIIADLDSTYWATAHYGTTMLLDARLPIASLFRVHYTQTRMDRDALFVDIALGSDSEEKLVRLCNSHLESLAMDPPLRPAQMQVIARYLHAQEVHAGVTTGDFNAIQPFDRTLHADNKLKDAYLELGGKEDSDEGFTWGQQAPTKFREQFGCSRMNKVYFCGDIKLREFKRFGYDIQLPEAEVKQREEIVALGFDKPWITDHLGISAVLEIEQQQGSEVHL